MSEAATAAPPAGPAATPPPTAGPQSATVEAPFNDAFADLDKMIGGDESPPPAAAGADTPSPAETPTTKTGEGAAPSAKPASESGKSTPAPVPDAKGEPPIEKMAAPELRKTYFKLKAKLTEIEKERDTFKEQLSKPPPEDTEKKTLAERLTAREKRLQEMEGILRLKAYEESDEYKQKWHQPFVDAYSDGREAVANIKVAAEGGEVRQGTPEDWDRYMRIQDEDEAAEFADQTFGNKRGMVEYHRMQVLQKNKARIKAIEEQKKSASDLEKQHNEQRQTANKAIGEFWSKSNETAAKKYPHWFAPADGDEKGNQLLSRGMHLADRAFSSGQPLADGDKPLSPQELVALHSAIRNKAGGFDRLAWQHAQAQKRIKTLEAKIAEYEKSEPGHGEGKRGEGTTTPLGWEAELERRAHPA